MSLFSFQGRVSLATRQPNGKPGAFIEVGNVPTCQLALAVETTTKNESMSGQRLPYGRIVTAKNATITINFDEWLKQNLAVGFYATPQAIAEGTVTAEAFPDDLVAGDRVMLDHPGVSDLVITDSAAVPATVPTSKYSLVSPGNGVVQIVDPTALTQPLKAAYSYSAGIDLGLFTTPSPERYFLLEGVNTETGNAVRVELYRVRFDPFSQIDLINEAYGSLPMTGSVLFDPLADTDEALGGFGRIRSVDG
jgi:hypothetical protein